MRPQPQCLACARRREPVAGTIQVCDAFPQGIPMAIIRNQVDHREPQPGDHDLQWESLNGLPFPEHALAANLPKPPAA